MSFRRYRDDLHSIPECVLGLIDALSNWRMWLKEWAYGVRDPYTGGWEIEPNETALRELGEVEALLDRLKQWELYPDLRAILSAQERPMK